MILSRILGERRSKVTNFGHPSSWKWDDVRKFFATPTAAGVTVTHDSLLGLPALWDGIRQIAQDTAFLPVSVLRSTGDDRRERIREHRVWFLLNRQFNPEMSAAMGRETMSRHLEVYGNGLAEIERDGSDNILWLWPLHPASVRLIRDDGTSEKHVYAVTRANGTETLIPPRNMLHVAGPSEDGVTGLDIVQVLGEALGLNLASLRAASGFFSNGMRLSGVIQVPMVPKKEAREEAEREFKEKYQGANNAGNTLFLYGDAKYNPISTTLEHAQMPEMMQVSVMVVAQVLGMPLYKLKEMSRATWANIEHLQIDYAMGTILPRCQRWEHEIWRKLFSEKEQRDHYVKYNIDGMIRGDFKTRSEAIDSGIQTGRITINEALALEDRNGIGPTGDVRLVPVNLQTLDRAIEGPEEPEPEPEPDDEEEPDEEEDDGDQDREAARAAMVAAARAQIRGCIAKEQNRIGEKAERLYKANRPGEFVKWLDKFYDDHRGAYVAAFRNMGVAEPGRLAGVAWERHCVPAKGSLVSAVTGSDPGAWLTPVRNVLTEWSYDNYVGRLAEGVIDDGATN